MAPGGESLGGVIGAFRHIIQTEGFFSLYKGLVPSTSLATSDPETVFNIKYFSRDQRYNRPPIRRTMLNKDDIVKAMKEKSTFDVVDFTMVYLTTVV